jgi:hypothetical protein
MARETKKVRDLLVDLVKEYQSSMDGFGKYCSKATAHITGDVEARAKGGEGRRREAFGEDVCELGRRRYM